MRRAAQRERVAVIGAGQHGLVVATTLEAAGYQLAGFYDDRPESWGTAVGSSTVVGPPGEIPSGRAAIIAIGDNETRRHIAQSLDLEWATVVHPFAWIDPGVPLGAGTVVCVGVTVQIGAAIGAHAILNNRTSLGHDAQVADFAHLTVAHLGSGAQAGEGAFLGIGSVVLPNVRVGAWSTVGAGAVVLKDVAPGETVVGNPARRLRTRGAAKAGTETSR